MSSALKHLFQRVCDLQKDWTFSNSEKMNERGRLVRDSIPEIIRSHSSKLSGAIGIKEFDFGVEGRDGTGRKTEVPWVRYYSEQRAPTAREGWYCVYLFHALGKGLYLALGHGSTRFIKGAFVPRSDEELRDLTNWARGAAKQQISELSNSTKLIELGARRTNLGDAYEKGTVIARWYDAASIPDDEDLQKDARLFAKALGALYGLSDLGRAHDSVSPEIEAAERIIERVARPVVSQKVSGGQGYGLNAKERAVVEKHAMTQAIKHLSQIGFEVEDVSAKQPFDLIAKRDDAKLIIEVKGTTGSAENILLTAGEVDAHKKAFPHNGLIIVSMINLKRHDIKPKAADGILTWLNPWEIVQENLTPIAFRLQTSIAKGPIRETATKSDQLDLD